MLGIFLAMTLAAAGQDEKPLAGYLPPADRPMPRDDSRRADRPRGKLFISPMGEPFRGDDPVHAWFDGADADHDGVLTKTEFTADAMRFFARLDRGRDGEIDPDDIEFYETALVPEIRVGGAGGLPGGNGGGGRGHGRGGGGGHRGGGGEESGDAGSSGDGGRAATIANRNYEATRRGAARYAFFDYPEPVTVADTNFNRGIDAGEFKAAALDRFVLLDKNGDGRITRGELPHIDLPESAGGFGGQRPGVGQRIRPQQGEVSADGATNPQ